MGGGSVHEVPHGHCDRRDVVVSAGPTNEPARASPPGCRPACARRPARTRVLGVRRSPRPHRPLRPEGRQSAHGRSPPGARHPFARAASIPSLASANACARLPVLRSTSAMSNRASPRRTGSSISSESATVSRPRRTALRGWPVAESARAATRRHQISVSTSPSTETSRACSARLSAASRSSRPRAASPRRARKYHATTDRGGRSRAYATPRREDLRRPQPVARKRERSTRGTSPTPCEGLTSSPSSPRSASVRGPPALHAPSRSRIQRAKNREIEA